METTTTICKNCDAGCQGNYCSNCGQSSHTESINWHYVWHEIEHGIFHVDKGIFYTIKMLFTTPGKAIRAFIEGRRKNYFKPAAMVFLLASICGFLYHYFDLNITPGDMASINDAPEAIQMQQKINAWITSHFALVTLLSIPLYASASNLMFRKDRYNYVEHLVMNSFLAGQKLVVQLALFPLVVYYNGTDTINTILIAMFIIDIIITGWTYSDFFVRYGLATKIFRTIIAYIIVLLLSLLIGTAAGILLVATGLI